MTSASRGTAMRAILMFHNHEVQSHKTVSTDHNFWRERKAETDSNRSPSAYQPNALPLGQTGSQVAPFLPSLINRKRFLSVDAKPKQKETGQKVGKRKHRRREGSALAGWAFDVPWPAEPSMCSGRLSLRWCPGRLSLRCALAGWAFDVPWPTEPSMVPWPAEPSMCPGRLSLRCALAGWAFDDGFEGLGQICRLCVEWGCRIWWWQGGGSGMGYRKFSSSAAFGKREDVSVAGLNRQMSAALPLDTVVYNMVALVSVRRRVFGVSV